MRLEFLPRRLVQTQEPKHAFAFVKPRNDGFNLIGMHSPNFSELFHGMKTAQCRAKPTNPACDFWANPWQRFQRCTVHFINIQGSVRDSIALLFYLPSALNRRRIQLGVIQALRILISSQRGVHSVQSIEQDFHRLLAKTRGILMNPPFKVHPVCAKYTPRHKRHFNPYSLLPSPLPHSNGSKIQLHSYRLISPDLIRRK